MESSAGDLCVLREEGGSGWVVSLCGGDKPAQALGRFATREEATAFALAERERRNQRVPDRMTVHFPDDCPCYRAIDEAAPKRDSEPQER
jgi:hypothetical protein